MFTVRELSASFRRGTDSPTRLTTRLLEKAERLKPMNYFITLLGEAALKAAQESERRFTEGRPLGPLDGIPVAVKDVFYVEGIRCTAGSKILANHIATYDAPAVSCLREAGAVLIGTTNMHEFGGGVTSDNPHYGPVRNPWDDERVAGGSSGGSAAAVASGAAVVGLGADTAGSVRIPSALCGVLGFKPTYGRISRLGVVPLAPSFDTVGTITSCAWDAALLLRTLSGHRPEDITTADAPVPDYLSGLEKPRNALRVGVPKGYFADSVDPLVWDAFAGFLRRLEEIGCTLVDINLEAAAKARDCFFPIRWAEATAFHSAWLESSPGLYGKDLLTSLERGKQVSAVDYVDAQNSRPGLMEKFIGAMEGCDLIATPTTCITAPRIGQDGVQIRSKEVKVYTALNDLTLPFNVVGFPAVSVPAGTASGMPVGAQLVGRPFDEQTLLSAANSLELKFGPYPSPTH